MVAISPGGEAEAYALCLYWLAPKYVEKYDASGLQLGRPYAKFRPVLR